MHLRERRAANHCPLHAADNYTHRPTALLLLLLLLSHTVSERHHGNETLLPVIAATSINNGVNLDESLGGFNGLGWARGVRKGYSSLAPFQKNNIYLTVNGVFW